MSPTVTIVGAGISGIKAAVDLTKAGIKVVMLEGRDRIGGRIKTLYPHSDNKEIHYDVGASWLHETLENELFPFAVENKVPLYYDDGGVAFYYNGKPLDPEEKSLRVFSDFVGSTKLYAGEELSTAKTEDREPKIPTVKDYSKQWVGSFPLLSDYNRKVLPQLARSAELYVGIPWEQISIEASGGPAGAGRDAFVTAGYTSVLNLIYDQIDKNLFELHLNEEVKSIDSTKDSVTIGTVSGKEFTADYSVVTIPAGLLKTVDWKSQLPSKLEQTIKNAHMAKLSKVIFEFDQVFWPETLDRMFVLGNGSDNLEPGSFPVMFVAGNRIWGRPALITILGPPVSSHLEENPTDAFKYLEPALKAIAADGKSVPKPTKTIVTDWQKEKFSEGSYSAIAVGENGWEIINSYKTGAGNIRFAGEHTVTEGDGCVHGAFASGKREAKYILSKIGN